MKRIIVGAVVAAIGLLTCLVGVSTLKQAFASKSWPSTTGVIQTSEIVTEFATHNRTMYSARVVYSYKVADKEYQGSQVRVGGGSSGSDRGSYEKTVQRYPVQKEVTVWYDAKEPENAVLETGLSFSAFLPLAIGLLFFVVGVILLAGQVLSRITVGKRRPPQVSVATAGDNALSPSALLTPSEIVVLNGTVFAAQRLIGNTTLLDGKTKVSRHELVEGVLKAALLAHERAGSIRLDVGEPAVDGRDSSPTLFVEPTGQQVTWPSPSVEARLIGKYF